MIWHDVTLSSSSNCHGQGLLDERTAFHSHCIIKVRHQAKSGTSELTSINDHFETIFPSIHNQALAHGSRRKEAETCIGGEPRQLLKISWKISGFLTIFMWAGSAPAPLSTPAWLSTSLWLLGDLMKTQVTQWANGQDYQSAVETSLEDANLSNASIPKRFSTKDRNTEAPGEKKQLQKVPTPHITDF